MASIDVARGARADGRVSTLWGPILGALVVAFVLDLLLSPPKRGVVGFSARVAGFLLAAGLAFFFGRYLGKHAWPKRGQRLAAALVRRTLRAPHPPMVFLTDRADFRPRASVRIVEVVAFAAGSSVIFASVLVLLLRVDPSRALASTGVGVFTLVTLWGSFLLVPYWLFGRMGLRQVDPVRWLIQPMSRRYADRLRLSNGFLMLVALGLLINVVYRAESSQEEAVLSAVVTLTRIVASVLVVAASAVAYYTAQEDALMLGFEEETLREGIRDARGMTDAEFLPRPPAPPQHPTLR